MSLNEREEMIKTLETTFHPQSIAVVGASSNPISFGYNFLFHLLDYGYSGKIYPVNPREQTIFDLKSYPLLPFIFCHQLPVSG